MYQIYDEWGAKTGRHDEAFPTVHKALEHVKNNPGWYDGFFYLASDEKEVITPQFIIYRDNIYKYDTLRNPK